MARKVIRRKANTSLVLNPSPRGLSIGGRNTVRRSAPRTNPTTRTAAVDNPRHKRRRRRRNPAGVSVLRNPSGVGGLVAASLFAGGAITVIDMALSRLAPSASPVVQIMLKGGLALAFQSGLGNKLPFGFAKYKDDIALVLGVMAAAQAINLWVLPTATQFVNQITGQVTNLINPPAATAPATLQGIPYRRPAYV